MIESLAESHETRILILVDRVYRLEQRIARLEAALQRIKDVSDPLCDQSHEIARAALERICTKP